MVPPRGLARGSAGPCRLNEAMSTLPRLPEVMPLLNGANDGCRSQALEGGAAAASAPQLAAQASQAALGEGGGEASEQLPPGKSAQGLVACCEGLH